MLAQTFVLCDVTVYLEKREFYNAMLGPHSRKKQEAEHLREESAKDYCVIKYDSQSGSDLQMRTVQHHFSKGRSLVSFSAPHFF